MFRCILGERGSGKSVFVENMVKEMDSHALYIATLDKEERYWHIIDRHRKRRPDSWECIELFEMKADEILTYPYWNFRNVILDNLSYYVLLQIYTNKEAFIRECAGRGFSLVRQIAEDKNTMFYIVDTPLREQEEFLEKDEKQLVRQLFWDILYRAEAIERFYAGEILDRMTAKEGKKYLFTNGEKACLDRTQ